jgi:hypothetical protein
MVGLVLNPSLKYSPEGHEDWLRQVGRLIGVALLEDTLVAVRCGCYVLLLQLYSCALNAACLWYWQQVIGSLATAHATLMLSQSSSLCSAAHIPQMIIQNNPNTKPS